MASPTPRAQTSLSDVALGLVVERPGRTSEVFARLNERLGATQFSEQALRKALRRLEERKLVCLAGEVYVATSGGVERFQKWLWASLSLPPVREELLAKVALCRVEDLPRMVVAIRDAELGCVSMVADLNRVLREERRMVERVTARRRYMVVVGAELAWWESRIVWLQRLRGDLEEERRRLRAESASGPPPGA
jgi:hypothetical protein